MPESDPARAPAEETAEDTAEDTAEGIAPRSDLLKRALADQLTETVCALLHAEGSALLDLEPGQQRYRVIGARGSAAPLGQAVVSIAPSASLVRDAIALRRAVASNVENDPRIDTLIRNVLPIRNVAVAPIILNDAVVGLLGCFNTRDDHFTDQHLTLLDHLAAHAALVVRNQQLEARALGELVAVVAHEINNPLTGISAFAEMLLEEELTDDQRESVRLIKQESDRAKRVIHDLQAWHTP